MRKIDLAKAREHFGRTESQRAYFDLETDNLVELAKNAQTDDAEYIEVGGWASTTELNDRGFRIAASTWKDESAFSRFDGNPIVLFNHKRDFPIGTCTAREGKDEGLHVRLRIRRNALLPTGEKVGDLVADGTLRTLSVGIDIRDFEILEADDRIIPIVTKVGLFEITLTTIPSDQGAIVSALSKAIELSAVEDGEGENKGGFTMYKLLAKKFGMPETATEAEVMAEFQRREALGASAITALGLNPDTATADQITAALAARDPKKIEDLQNANAKLQARAAVDGAVKAHKIAEKDEKTIQWALSFAEKDPEGFKLWADGAPANVPPTTTIVPGTVAPTGGSTETLTADDIRVCKQLGVFKDPKKMELMADLKPSEALEFVFPGQTFIDTEADRQVLAKREAIDELAGIVK